jgi:hypothetical protein
MKVVFRGVKEVLIMKMNCLLKTELMRKFKHPKSITMENPHKHSSIIRLVKGDYVKGNVYKHGTALPVVLAGSVNRTLEGYVKKRHIHYFQLKCHDTYHVL